MMCEHDYWQMQGFRPTCIICGHSPGDEERAKGHYPELSNEKIMGKFEQYIKDLEQRLAAANARVAELEYKLMAQTETALQENAKREQAEAQNKRTLDAINRYVIGNIELLDALKAALEEKQ